MATIVKIEEIEPVEQACIYCSSKDHLYVGDGIITHNTIITGIIPSPTYKWSFEEQYMQACSTGSISSILTIVAKN